MRAACSQGAVADCGFQRVIWRRRRLKGNGLMSDDLLFIDDEPVPSAERNALACWQVMMAYRSGKRWHEAKERVLLAARALATEWQHTPEGAC